MRNIGKLGGLTLLLTLASSGCGPGDGWLGEAPALSGRIQNWPQGKVASVEVYRSDVPVAPIGADGAFRVGLPAEKAISGRLTAFLDPNSTCPQHPDVDPPTLKTAWLSLNVRDALNQPPEGLPLLTHDDRRPETGEYDPWTTVDYLYSDSDARVTGTTFCGQDESNPYRIEFQYDFLLKRGWNSVLIQTAGRSPQDFRIIHTTGPAPDEARWWVLDPDTFSIR